MAWVLMGGWRHGQMPKCKDKYGDSGCAGMTASGWRRSDGVVFSGGGEDVEDFGVFEGGGLVLDVAGDEEAVAGAGEEDAAGVFEADAAAEDVDHLFVGMAVAGADPAGGHGVADEHDCGARRHDLAAQAGFGRGHGGVVGRGDGDFVRWHGFSLICLRCEFNARWKGQYQMISSMASAGVDSSMVSSGDLARAFSPLGSSPERTWGVAPG